MDLASNVCQHLSTRGLAVVQGSFGTPYVVTVLKPNNLIAIRDNALIPEKMHDCDILIIDLVHARLDPSPPESVVTRGEFGYYTRSFNGYIDPRPLNMVLTSAIIDDILKAHGVVVVFADSASPLEVTSVSRITQLIQEDSSFDIWSFLTKTYPHRLLIAQYEEGDEIAFVADDALTELLQRYAGDISFSTTFSIQYALEGNSRILIKNKRGRPVSFMISDSRLHNGQIFVFPQMTEKAQFLEHFLTEYLPNTAPHLYPYHTQRLWTTEPIYQLPEVQQIHADIDRLKQETAAKIADLESDISTISQQNQYLYELLTETDTPLVSAVQQALSVLGFARVIDMDAQLVSTSSDPNRLKREDLQIQDRSPLLLVEVKGINGTPRDTDAFQVVKYVSPRMRELKRTDITPLVIINHERNKPGLQRQANPFGVDILASAQDQKLGLLTTWNLHRLVRNFIKFKWPSGPVMDLFYQSGAIDPIPTHLEYVGDLEDVWEKVEAIGVRIKQNALRLGDTIYLISASKIEYLSQKITSLQVDKQPVETVTIDQLAGISSSFRRTDLPKDTQVYREISI